MTPLKVLAYNIYVCFFTCLVDTLTCWLVWSCSIGGFVQIPEFPFSGRWKRWWQRNLERNPESLIWVTVSIESTVDSWRHPWDVDGQSSPKRLKYHQQRTCLDDVVAHHLFNSRVILNKHCFTQGLNLHNQMVTILNMVKRTSRAWSMRKTKKSHLPWKATNHAIEPTSKWTHDHQGMRET